MFTTKSIKKNIKGGKVGQDFIRLVKECSKKRTKENPLPILCPIEAMKDVTKWLESNGIEMSKIRLKDATDVSPDHYNKCCKKQEEYCKKNY